MNKTELVRMISEKTGNSLKESQAFLEAFSETVTESVKKGNEVNWIGFGTFSVIDRPARMARNFRTGEQIKVAASKAVKFKPGKLLKDCVKQKQIESVPHKTGIVRQF